MNTGPRIYNLFPSLVGSIERWTTHLARIAAMGFDWVYVNPFHEPGYSGSLYAVKSYYRLNPLFRGKSKAADEELIGGFTAATKGTERSPRRRPSIPATRRRSRFGRTWPNSIIARVRNGPRSSPISATSCGTTRV